ncbi:MAG TPA: RNA 2',3'-cyclic phosphodiesterase [Vicinamibacteria bacterium]|nr:RNA 2',3'-cyclic phosphodiesterase [Vicinamibacteria bacterium]
MSTSPLRAFIALDVDEGARERLVGLLQRLAGEVPGVRWVRAEGLHVTVRFLGWTDAAVLGRIEDAVAPAARDCAPAQAALGPLGLFPERGSPRVLWVGLDLPPRMHALQRACEQAARHEGFEPEERAFRPHVTLGRWKDRARRPVLPAPDLGTAHVTQLTLYRSELRPSGAVYTPLHRFDLGR